MYNNPNYQIPRMLVLYLIETEDSTCLPFHMSYRRSASYQGCGEGYCWYVEVSKLLLKM